MKTAIEVVVGIVFREGLVLLTRRLENVHLGGLWEFPGGKREQGETEKTALAREMREELGVRVVVGDCLHRTRFDYPERSVSLAFYRCEISAGEPRPLASSEMRWVKPAGIDPAEMPPANAQILKILCGNPP